jgi:hypothetical protein
LHVPTQTRRFTDNQQDRRFIGRGSKLEGLWLAKEIWPDSTVFVIGGGSSVSSMPLNLIRGKHIVGVNSAIRLGPWITVNFFGDARWLIWEYETVKRYKGLLVTCQARLKNPEDIDIKRLSKSKMAQGLSTKRHEVSWNNSSGGAAINLAYHLGARRIVLIGYDMKAYSGHHNFHDSYPLGKPDRNPYRHFLRAFNRIKDDANRLGVEILNATPSSALKIFPKVELEEVVNGV